MSASAPSFDHGMRFARPRVPSATARPGAPATVSPSDRAALTYPARHRDRTGLPGRGA